MAESASALFHSGLELGVSVSSSLELNPPYRALEGNADCVGVHGEMGRISIPQNKNRNPQQPELFSLRCVPYWPLSGSP